MIDLDCLHRLLPPTLAVDRAAMVELQTRALAHAHVSLGRACPWLLRIPLHSQHGHAPEANLRYQAACFREASRSGHAPQLHSTLPPSADLPMGALIVERIDGPAITLPQELPLVAEALAAIHALPTDGKLPAQPDPLPFLRREVAQQAQALPLLAAAGDLSRDSRAQLNEELGWLARWQPDGCEPMALVATDCHPGNFLRRDGRGGAARAVLVDLEKALYGSAAVDLAHASVYTSTTWDPQRGAVLSDDQVAAFYQTYLDRLPAGRRAALRPWLLPMRRLLWLRAVTWCAHWRAAQQRDDQPWAGLASDTRSWVAERTAHYLAPDIIAHARRDWQADGLAKALGLGR